MGRFLRRGVFAVTLILSGFTAGFAHGKCISSWSEVDQLGDRVEGIDLARAKISGTVRFRLAESGTLFTLSRRDNKIYAKTPEGNAFVSLCTRGSGLTAVAYLGIFGKKEAKIESLGSGNFRIKTKAEVYKASVVR